MDSLEEGGLRASSSHSKDLDDHDNEKTIDSLHDRVSFLKRVSSVRILALFHDLDLPWMSIA